VEIARNCVDAGYKVARTRDEPGTRRRLTESMVRTPARDQARDRDPTRCGGR
jgi:hypothetical protein